MSASSLESADASKTFTSFVADINLLTEIPAGQATAVGQPARHIRINAGTALSIQYASGCTDTITGLAAGTMLDVKAVKILSSGSVATSVTAFW